MISFLMLIMTKINGHFLLDFKFRSNLSIASSILNIKRLDYLKN